MDTADKKTLKQWTTIIVIAIVVILALFFGTQKCAAQGTINLSLDYSAKLEEAFTIVFGTEWKAIIRDRLREAWKNHKSTAIESYKTQKSAIFEEGADLTAGEKVALQVLDDSLRARKERQRLADSAAAAQPQSLLYDNNHTTTYAANIGKALSSKMAFFENFEETKQPSLQHSVNIFDDPRITTTVIIVGIIVAGFIVIAILG